MFAMGTIVDDPYGVLFETIEAARTALKVAPPKMTEQERQQARYTIWDGMNEMESLKITENPSVDVMASIFFKEVHELYCAFLGAESMPFSKQYSYFADPEFRRRAGLPEFADSVYSELFLGCLSAEQTDERIERVEELADYVLDKLGGFDAASWKSTSLPKGNE